MSSQRCLNKHTFKEKKGKQKKKKGKLIIQNKTKKMNILKLQSRPGNKYLIVEND